MAKKLFGSGSKSTSTQQSKSGFGALPDDIKEKYRGLLGNVETVLGDPSAYFAPMDLTGEEERARGLINLYQDPDAYRAQIETYLSPYRDIVTEDINRAFEDPYSALKSRASEAGAFGSSRMRNEEADLEESRLRAQAAAMQSQYNTAQGQLQQSIGNLLGFGGLERGIDLQQRMALPQAIGLASGVYSPLLNASEATSTQVQKGASKGLLGSLGGGLMGFSDIGGISGLGSMFGFGGGASGLSSGALALAGFSDKRLKENIKYLGMENNHKVYEFNYINDPITKYKGVIAQDVLESNPEAVNESGGFYKVDYDKLGIKIEVICH